MITYCSGVENRVQLYFSAHIVFVCSLTMRKVHMCGIRTEIKRKKLHYNNEEHTVRTAFCSKVAIFAIALGGLFIVGTAVVV